MRKKRKIIGCFILTFILIFCITFSVNAKTIESYHSTSGGPSGKSRLEVLAQARDKRAYGYKI